MQEKKSYIPFWLLDIVSFISGIVTIGGAVVGAFEVRKIVANLPNEKYEVNLNSWLICLTISLAFFAGCCIFTNEEIWSAITESEKGYYKELL